MDGRVHDGSAGSAAAAQGNGAKTETEISFSHGAHAVTHIPCKKSYTLSAHVVGWPHFWAAAAHHGHAAC